MDFSKLPKLSQTPNPDPASSPQPPVPDDLPVQSDNPSAEQASPTAPTRPMRCLCGNIVTADMKFCQSCGRYLQVPGLDFRPGQYDDAQSAALDIFGNAIAALFFVWQSLNFWTYYLNRSGFTMTYNDANQSPMQYRDTGFYQLERAVALTAVVVIIHACFYAIRKLHRVAIVPVVLLVIAIIFNAYAIFTTRAVVLGLPIINYICVIYCIYQLIVQFNRIAIRRTASHPTV